MNRKKVLTYTSIGIIALLVIIITSQSFSFISSYVVQSWEARASDYGGTTGASNYVTTQCTSALPTLLRTEQAKHPGDTVTGECKYTNYAVYLDATKTGQTQLYIAKATFTDTPPNDATTITKTFCTNADHTKFSGGLIGNYDGSTYSVGGFSRTDVFISMEDLCNPNQYCVQKTSTTAFCVDKTSQCTQTPSTYCVSGTFLYKKDTCGAVTATTCTYGCENNACNPQPAVAPPTPANQVTCYACASANNRISQTFADACPEGFTNDANLDCGTQTCTGTTCASKEDVQPDTRNWIQKLHEDKPTTFWAAIALTGLIVFALGYLFIGGKRK